MDIMLKIDQIWCSDLKTAQRVKAEITNGGEFDKAKKEYSLYPDEQAHNTSPSSEGFFWDSLWADSEPNEIIGPIKGFNSDSVKWRIVKILEKKPGKLQEYSSELENYLKYPIITEKSSKIMADYCIDALKKYTYEIYTDRIKDINPMNIQ